MLSVVEIESRLSNIKTILENKYAVSKIGYFGSYVLGNATESSDVDILVELKRPIGWAFFDLRDYLEIQLAAKVDLTTVAALKEQLKDKILKQVKYV